jgi:hypothetical protein
MAQQNYSHEFSYTTDGVPTTFRLGGIADDVAKGIRAGLRKVPTITDVTARKVSEQAVDLGGTDPI